MTAKHLSTWFCFTALATLACGGRTLETGGETSFLSCETDDECATACVEGRCAPADGNVVGAPPTDTTGTSTGETTSETASSVTPEGTTSTDAPVDTTSTGIGGGTSSSATTDGTTSTDTPALSYELLDGVEEPFSNVSSAFAWSKAIGNWFTITEDGSTKDSERVEFDPPRDDNHFAYWAGGDSAMVDVYAQLRHPEGTEIDLSAYAGISFWARGTGTELGLSLAVNAAQLFQTGLSARAQQKPLSLTDEWQRFDVMFAELVGVTSISTIDFLVDGRSGAFDVWIDDLALICSNQCPR